MASSKEFMASSRPLTHRPSLSSMSNGNSPLAANASNSPANRQQHVRTGSHSIVGAAVNSTHRVSRRKSMTSSVAPNAATVAALIQEAELSNGVMVMGARRNTVSNKTGFSSGSLGILPKGINAMAAALSAAGTNGTNGFAGSLPLPSPPASLPTRKFMAAHGSAIDDGNDMSDGEIDSTSLTDANAIAFEIARVRRASDGQPLTKDGRRGSRMELRCKKCGKGYKHSSCLTKHLWEHTPEWNLTSKLLISKHQQVQLLEAASVLVTMNHKPTDGPDACTDDVATLASATTPPDSTQDFGSDQDSASPDASRFSDQNDDRSSIDTTPPPTAMEGLKRESSIAFSPPASRFASGISQLYQSSLPAGIAAANIGTATRDHLRPVSSGKMTGQEDNELAAAVDMLSCSFNSAVGENRTSVVGSLHTLGQDVPPVPLVPVQYLGQSATPIGDTSFISSFPSRAPESFARGEGRRLSEVDDVRMESSSSSDDEDDHQSHGRSEDEDDGVFGRMEE